MFKHIVSLLLLLALTPTSNLAAQTSSIYVSPSGEDECAGGKDAPIATLKRAISLAREKRISTIVLTEGRHQLTHTLDVSFDTRTPLTIVGEGNAIISGGAEVANFKRVSDNLYAADVGHLLTGRHVNFRQLFRDGERLPRAQMPNEDRYFFTDGQVNKYRGIVKPWDYSIYAQFKQDNPEIFTTFSYYQDDMKPEWLSPFTEVLLHHSWASSYHTIRELDVANKDVFLNTPSVWPVGFFGKHGDRLKYKLFNHLSFLDQPGEWMIHPEEGLLYYLASEGEDVSRSTFVLPVLTTLIKLHQSSDVKFKNLTFSHTDFHMGVYRWGVSGIGDTPWREISMRKHPDWPQDYYPGFCEPQAALKSGDALLVAKSNRIRFSGCRFSSIGAYGLWIKDRSSNVTISNCVFDDLGGGAVKIGELAGNMVYDPNLAGDLTHHNVVRNCVIGNGGKTMPGAVGIWISQSHDNLIKDNRIFNLPYSGISLGWNWKVEKNHTRRNHIVGNTIHDVLQFLTDGGGIYTLGILEDCVIEANEIYNIFRPDDIAGSNSNGIFCDNKSQGLTIINNYIHNIKNAPIRFNDCHHSWMKKVEGNFFDVKYIPVKYNNNYNMDFDEDGFMRVVIEGNQFGVKDGTRWKAKFR